MGPGKAEYLNQFSLLSGYLRAFPGYQRKWAIKDLTTLILPYRHGTSYTLNQLSLDKHGDIGHVYTLNILSFINCVVCSFSIYGF
jgi:hypothetical protein